VTPEEKQFFERLLDVLDEIAEELATIGETLSTVIQKVDE
jgi:hypothetical protein